MKGISQPSTSPLSKVLNSVIKKQTRQDDLLIKEIKESNDVQMTQTDFGTLN